ncbi:MAG: hypothetical protein ACJ72O_03960 [Marmoricola sp.]
MSLTTFARSRSRVALALVAGLVLVGALSNPADAIKPAGSRIAVQLESGTSASGDPANAITSGWWGHEGGANNGTGTGTTYLSSDASNGAGTVDDASLAAMLAAMGTDDLSKIYYAIVPTSADGSTEHPTVTAGENAAEAFHWILYQNWGGPLNGTANANDSVSFVSTLSQVTNWVNAGQPVQGFDSGLVLHDSTVSGNPVSTAPKGTSILNTWPAGTQLSLVAYVINGFDTDLANQVPIVADDGTGHAKTAWLPFTTVGKPGDSLRTSAGYVVAGAYAPTVATAASYSSTGATLTATVKDKFNATATDATGNIEFSLVTNGVPGTPTSVATVNGVASLPIPGFTSGSKIYDAKYVPDSGASTKYLTSAPKRTTMTAPIATTTKLTVVGGTTSDTLTATVSPKVAGKVVFTDTTSSGTSTLGTATVSTSTGLAKLVKALSARKHTIKATFTPTSTTYKASSISKTVWKPSITVSYSDSTPTHGTTPKMTVKVVAVGTTVSGTITITWDPPSGTTKYLKYTLVNGAKTIVLPKMVLGTTKITIKYSGNSTVLAATKATLLKAH